MSTGIMNETKITFAGMIGSGEKKDRKSLKRESTCYGPYRDEARIKAFLGILYF